MRIGQRKVKETVTNRKCRGCSKFLPESRYFNCLECQPELPDINEDFLYITDDDLDIDWFDAPSKKESERLVELLENSDEDLEHYEDELESYNSDEEFPY